MVKWVGTKVEYLVVSTDLKTVEYSVVNWEMKMAVYLVEMLVSMVEP